MKPPAAPHDPTISGTIVPRRGSLLPIWFLLPPVRPAHTESLRRQITSLPPAAAGWTFPSQLTAFTVFTPKKSGATFRTSNFALRSAPFRISTFGDSFGPLSANSTFPSQVPDLTLFDLSYLRTLRPRSNSFHQKTPVIPLIPLNSTYAVPRNEFFLTNSKMSTFPSQTPISSLFFVPRKQPLRFTTQH